MKNLAKWCVAWIAVASVAGCGTRPAPEVIADLGDGVKLEMVLIPAGAFTMGDDAGLDDEKPAHKVTITKPFYLGKHEVTVEQFRRFVEATGYLTDAEKGTGFEGAFGWDREAMEFAMNAEYSWRSPGFPQSDTDPVVNVSWNDAVAFCEWLSREEGKSYRLPTEAEWEYACRAGTTTDYSHGDDPEGVAKVGNVADAEFAEQFPELEGLIKASDGFVHTSPAGSFPPNAFGLRDMHGNVWEWCADWYDPEYYALAPANDPLGPAAGEERVYRGGGWFNCTRGCRSASRSASQPENRNLTLGFRVAMTAE
ncbi:MAG: formylglycine-generating enzyme family protein [Patescibacteria group bacterium]|nr:formylglycine-generating enzyme family protein [Patescibacteria group bacterium]